MSHERPRWWDDLSDDELLARLVQHGVYPPLAAVAVIGRDDDLDLRAAIDEALPAPSNWR